MYSFVDRAPDVEQLLYQLMARAKAGDADGVAELFFSRRRYPSGRQRTW